MQYDDLGAFAAEQDLMRRLIGASRLPTLSVDISDNDIRAAVERIAVWTDTSGGL